MAERIKDVYIDLDIHTAGIFQKASPELKRRIKNEFENLFRHFGKLGFTSFLVTAETDDWSMVNKMKEALDNLHEELTLY